MVISEYAWLMSDNRSRDNEWEGVRYRTVIDNFRTITWLQLFEKDEKNFVLSKLKQISEN